MLMSLQGVQSLTASNLQNAARLLFGGPSVERVSNKIISSIK